MSQARDRFAPVRVIPITVRPTRRLLRAMAVFGLALRRAAPRRRPPRWAVRAAAWLEQSLGTGEVALITGASGGGKSTLLAALEHQLAEHGRSVSRVQRLDTSSRAVIDLVGGTMADALGALTRAGLGDATLLGRTPSELSEGERFRLALARACAGPGSRRTVLCDEFTSGLDRATAACVAAALGRWARATGARVAVATAQDDLAPALRPRVIVECDGDRVHARLRTVEGRWTTQAFRGRAS
ncbi:MAG: hypothetical protein HBSAPP03_10280 [Phycisphaerae bacterium]|nr:MAG: hypothetical protein HBSAPP03_10280 [Phycisphaerae bacterium]